MDLTASDLAMATALRHDLHRRPELSGMEHDTARAIAETLAALNPDRLLTGLGGHGVAAIFDSGVPGPTLMLRAELDGLPITETGTPVHRSQIPGKGHLCGHDGHMAILIAASRVLARRRPASGRVVILFQPAEETGAGAAAVLADPNFEHLRPDYALALHNLPGLDLGTATLDHGVVNCASRGLRIRLGGRTAHASMPETGRSPALAVAGLIEAFSRFDEGTIRDPDFARATVTHVRVGEQSFGVAPGEAEMLVTLRTLTDSTMAALVARAEALVRDQAHAEGLEVGIGHEDVFAHCENHAEAVAILAAALDDEGVAWREAGEPLRASEDFGRFGHGTTRSAMLYLGAGRDHPQLHNPDYDFPDALIGIGARLFLRAVRNTLG